ncbi:hypothetical protein KSS87_018665, partial [Heliosperma pusillum]
MQTLGNWVMKKERQGVTMQTLGDGERKTHCSHKELRFKQWVMKEDSSFTQRVTMQTM